MSGRCNMGGHKIHYDETSGKWIYSDNNEVVDPSKERSCIRCGKFPTPEGHDACIANLGTVANACCGHGTEEGYIQFDNGIVIRGYFTVETDTGDYGKLYPMKNIEKLQQLNPDEQLVFLTEFIGRWAGLESRDGSYIHDLTRVKEGYQYGTVGIDDFVEWDDSRVGEVASEILEWLNSEED